MRKIALFGFSANPPHIGHREMVKSLAGHYDLVVVIPCGERPDKSYKIANAHRLNMTKIFFDEIVSCGFENVVLSDEDVFEKEHAKTWELYQRYRSKFPDDKIVVVVGSDILPAICKWWAYGKNLWDEASFAIFVRDKKHFKDIDLPPRNEILLCQFDATKFSSTVVRQRLEKGDDVLGLIIDGVYEYIKNNKLYLKGG